MKENKQNTYVFFYVGEDVSQPKMLAESIFIMDQTAEIIHCSDESTPIVDFATRRFNFKSDRQRLMSSRLQAFAELGLNEPAIYVDTDMLCMKAIAARTLTKDVKTRFCFREFNLDWSFNGNFGGLDFSEYDKKPMGEVYPYVACATATTDSTVWRHLSDLLEGLHPKFKLWYGDQEAIKRYCVSGGVDPRDGLPETIYGCLPEFKEFVDDSALLHFKGPARKSSMTEAFAILKEQNQR